MSYHLLSVECEIIEKKSENTGNNVEKKNRKIQGKKIMSNGTPLSRGATILIGEKE